jgi:hypothetical protein
MSREWLKLYREFLWTTGMDIPRGIAFTLHAMCGLSYAYGKGDNDEQRARRVVRTKPADIAQRARTSVRTVSRDLRWAEANGLLVCLKRPRKGSAAVGEWLLNFPTVKQRENVVDTEERINDRLRLIDLRSPEETESDEIQSADTPFPSGVSTTP